MTFFANQATSREMHLSQAITDLRDARKQVDDAIDSKSVFALEIATRSLKVAISNVQKFPGTELERAGGLNDLANGLERMAYGDSQHACIYFNDGKKIMGCARHTGAQMYSRPPLYNHIQCTDIADFSLWGDADIAYGELKSLLAMVPVAASRESMEEAAKAYRSIGYYRLCQALRQGKDSLADSLEEFKKANVLAGQLSMPSRARDSSWKVDFVNVLLKTSQHQSVDCPLQCSVDEQQRPIPPELAPDTADEYYVWVPSENKQESQNIITDNDNIKLGCSGECTGNVISRELVRPQGIRKLVLSWNANAKDGGWIEVKVRGRHGGKPTDWYSVGTWTENANDPHRASVVGQDPINIDEVDFHELGVDSIELQVILSKTAKSPSPIVRSVSVSIAGRSGVKDFSLQVPSLSQMAVGGENWCSPTSIAMSLAYLSKEYQTSWTQSVRDISSSVFDDGAKIYGNWSFNVAYIAARTGGRVGAFVTHLSSLDEVEALLTSGIPVIVSIRWATGTLTGAAIASSKGHLVVIVGFDSSGNVVVNDPAGATDADVRRTYDRAQFDRAWMWSRRAAYVLASNNPETTNLLTRLGIRRAWP